MKVFIYVLLIVSGSAWADTPFFSDAPIGFLWGNLPKEQVEKLPPAQNNETKKEVSYTNMMEERKKQGDEIRSKMLVLKTPESAREWMQWEHNMWNEAEEIGRLTEYVKYYTNPEMNYELKHPTDHLSHQVYLSEQKQELLQSVQQFAANHGLLFFFSANCKYCHSMVPILQRVAAKYKIEILGISLDGGSIAGLDNIREDTGLAAKVMGEKIFTPAIFALNPNTGDTYPIIYGASSEQQLEEHIMSAVEYAKLYPEMVKRSYSS